MSKDSCLPTNKHRDQLCAFIVLALFHDPAYCACNSTLVVATQVLSM